MRLGRVAAAALAVGVLVGGCGGGPAQAGAAVIVDGDAVPLESVQSQLEVALSRADRLAALTAQGGGPADVARSIVGREVIHDLLPRRAAAEGITVSDAQVDTRIEESGGVESALASSIYDLPALRNRVRDDLIASALADKAVGGLSVTADLVAVTSRAEAEAAAQTLATGGPAADALFGDPQTSARGTVYDAVRHAGGGRDRAVRHPGRRRGGVPARPAAEHLDRLPGDRPAHRRPVRPGRGDRDGQHPEGDDRGTAAAAGRRAARRPGQPALRGMGPDHPAGGVRRPVAGTILPPGAASGG